MTLRIVRAKMERAEHQEKLARLVQMRQPDKPAPTEQEWINAARAIGCPPQNLIAVIRVESAGAAFNAEGRLTILYEPHVASRCSTPRGKWDKSHPRLSYGKWIDPRKVPKSEWHPYRTTQAERWDMLVEMAALDLYAGTAAASYGMFQILGENAADIGFRDPLHMIEVMYEGYEGHLEAFLRFCRRKGALDPLIRGDFARFARLYNGSGQAALYADRMKKAADDARRMIA